MKDKFDIMCELQDEASELHTLAAKESKKLRSLEKKYFEAALEKTKLESSLLEYKDRYYEAESSYSSKLASSW